MVDAMSKDQRLVQFMLDYDIDERFEEVKR